MASKTYAELTSELSKLRTEHHEDVIKAMFGGLNAEEEAAYQRRLDRLATLFRQINALNESAE